MKTHGKWHHFNTIVVKYFPFMNENAHCLVEITSFSLEELFRLSKVIKGWAMLLGRRHQREVSLSQQIIIGPWLNKTLLDQRKFFWKQHQQKQKHNVTKKYLSNFLKLVCFWSYIIQQEIYREYNILSSTGLLSIIWSPISSLDIIFQQSYYDNPLYHILKLPIIRN